MVDSADKERLETAKTELSLMLAEEELENASLLVLANKQDLPGSLDVAEISSALDLPALKDRQWTIFKASALTGEGLNDGLDWMVNSVQEKKK